MKQIIYDVIFRTWYNGGEKPKECEEVQSAIDSICNLFKADHKNRIFIEDEIMKAINESERIAFIDGLRMGVGLSSGRLFYDDLPELNLEPLPAALF